VTGTEAIVGGSVVSDVGGEVEYWVEYGPTTTYGTETEHATITVEENQPRQIAPAIAGLERSTTYHYRICARDSQQTGGPGCGDDRQFTTVNVDCGDKITSDLRLSGDLDCNRSTTSREDGLTVGADGIDINLAGHGVEGALFAIHNSGFDDATIRNGTLYAYSYALRLDGASRNRIRRVRAGRISNPLAEPPTVIGISIVGGEATVVRASHAEGQTTGLSATDSSGLLVEDTTGVAGMGSRGGAPSITVRGDLARILRNDLRSGISVGGSANRIARNLVRGVEFGIEVRAGEGNVLAENEVSDAITLFFPEEGDGILVYPEAVGTLLRANVAISNDEDGIDVRSPTTRLRDNRAERNGDFGIDAVEGVTDLGGNTASGNGNPLQCRNVFCG
jgi:parallel beta-helix repeat protein